MCSGQRRQAIQDERARKPETKKGPSKEVRFHCKCFKKPLEKFNQEVIRSEKQDFKKTFPPDDYMDKGGVWQESAHRDHSGIHKRGRILAQRECCCQRGKEMSSVPLNIHME